MSKTLVSKQDVVKLADAYVLHYQEYKNFIDALNKLETYDEGESEKVFENTLDDEPKEQESLMESIKKGSSKKK